MNFCKCSSFLRLSLAFFNQNSLEMIELKLFSMNCLRFGTLGKSFFLEIVSKLDVMLILSFNYYAF